MGPEGMRIADTGHAFLQALVERDIKVRALPIGPGGMFMAERRWFALSDAFTTLMSIPFINVVCAQAGELLGTTTPASTFAKSADLPEELRRLLAADGFTPDGKSADVDYVPQTVFGGLYTVGCMNVAIVTGMPDAHETAVLRKYNLVVYADLTYDELMGAPIDNHTALIPPSAAANLPDLMREVLGCLFDSSATSPLSPDTDAPPATTSPPSTPRASSSRSGSLARAPSRALSRAISTSTRSLARFRRWALRAARWTWRCFTRSRGSSPH